MISEAADHPHSLSGSRWPDIYMESYGVYRVNSTDGCLSNQGLKNIFSMILPLAFGPGAKPKKYRVRVLKHYVYNLKH